MKTSLLNELKSAVKNSNKPIIGNKSHGTRCVFLVKDVFKTQNMLSRLLRGIAIKENITIDLIKSCVRQAMVRTGRQQEKNSSYDDSTNIISAITRNAVSFNKCFELLSTILGYEVDLTIHLTKDGVRRSYNYKEVHQDMQKLLDENNEK